MTALAGLLGALAGTGVLLLVLALRGVDPGDLRPAAPTAPTLPGGAEGFTRRLLLALGLGLAVALFTRWPVGALLAAAAGYLLPTLLGGRAEREAHIAKVEGIASWAEMLRDTMAGAGGLEQSIIASAGVAPTAIRPQVARLATRLERDRLAPALRDFADELDDPIGDLVVAALVLAADKSPKRLGELLGRLADAARGEVTMRLRVEAGRARSRTSVRVVTIFTLLFVSALLLLNRDYLRAYDSAVGQAVLLLVGLCFGTAFWWLAQASRVETSERFLTSDLEVVR